MNKVALITGGSRGIGLGIARSLAEAGWNLAINGMRDESAVSGLLEDLRKYQVEVVYCQGNVGEQEDRQAILQKCLDQWGRIDALVNNAGVAPKERKDLLDMSEESFDRVLNINLKGSFFLSQLVAKEMLKQGNDSLRYIVNMSSVSATMVSVNRGQYCISKAGMAMMSQLFAARLAKENIMVYEVRPGVIKTDMTAAVKQKYDKLLLEEGLAVQERWGLPEDVGKAVASLLGGNFPYSTGQVIMVDGGLEMGRL
ncbi:3-ketoacyl-ACP reductase [Moorena bouillonii]|uniref:3-ketoacyl-ACP reductase n=1 Tax=Moorena bouillonii PNG TaxID=568701 RepID=A0A1U7NA33_9CYAN|nr:3-ketoacyl-ACP reductase [Moorena bouillonii]OLT62774.1 3-ketoacyl-ACP reductase [Moorena bouillonii PNG]